jgi:hypothetical protein
MAAQRPPWTSRGCTRGHTGDKRRIGQCGNGAAPHRLATAAITTAELSHSALICRMPPRTNPVASPRSYEEFATRVRKADGWADGVGSHLPHRILEDLIVRSNQVPSTFRDVDLPAAALLAVKTFLDVTYTFRPPRVQALLDELKTPSAREAATAAVAVVEQAIRDLGPVATWGTTHPARLPSGAQRLAAFTTAVEQAHAKVSLLYFLRYAQAADLHGSAACSLGADASWRLSADAMAVVRQSVGLLFDQGAMAVAYAEFADHYDLTVFSARDPGVVERGGMLVDLTRAMLAVRPPRVGPRASDDDRQRIEVEAAIRHIADVAPSALVPRERWIDAVLRWTPSFAKAVRAIAGATHHATVARVAGSVGTTADKVGDTIRSALDGLQQRQLHNAVTAAQLFAPIYEAAITGRKRVRSPEQAVPESKYAALYAAVSALRLSTFAPLEACVLSSPMTTAPLRYLHELSRDRRAHSAVWDFITRVTQMDPHAPVGTLPPVDDLVTARGGEQRDGRPVLGEGVTARGLHAAAIAVLQMRRGVPVAQLVDDLEKGRLPGVRGTCRGDSMLRDGVDRVWDLPHGLAVADAQLVRRTIRASDVDRVVHEARRVHSGWMPVARNAKVQIEVAGDPHLPESAHLALSRQRLPSLDPSTTYHRGPIADGAAGTLITDYAMRYADGRVRVRANESGVQPMFVRLAVLDGHETAAYLTGRSHEHYFDHPVALRWNEEIRPSTLGRPMHWIVGNDPRPLLVGAIWPTGRADQGVDVDFAGPMPAAARDILAQVGLHAPKALGLEPRDRRVPHSLEVLSEGTQPHWQALAEEAAKLVAPHPGQGPRRVTAAPPLPPFTVIEPRVGA